MVVIGYRSIAKRWTMPIRDYQWGTVLFYDPDRVWASVLDRKSIYIKIRCCRVRHCSNNLNPDVAIKAKPTIPIVILAGMGNMPKKHQNRSCKS